MKEDFQKFMELVKTDEALQKKMEEAGKNYDGEQTREAFFNAVVTPIAEEAGFSITIDDVNQAVQELNPDEMAQVAGGAEGVLGGGVGVLGCDGLGAGFGWAASVVGDLSWDNIRAGTCFLIGSGKVNAGCITLGKVNKD